MPDFSIAKHINSVAYHIVTIPLRLGTELCASVANHVESLLFLCCATPYCTMLFHAVPCHFATVLLKSFTAQYPAVLFLRPTLLHTTIPSLCFTLQNWTLLFLCTSIQRPAFPLPRHTEPCYAVPFLSRLSPK